MTITNEQLSAFLDAELPAADMERIRDAIVTDPSLTDRLAALASVDSLVKQAVTQATDKPLPEKLSALLDHNETASNVVQLSRWQRAKQNYVVPLAAAASIALVSVLSVNLWQQQTPDHVLAWQHVENVLENKVSGDTVTMPTGEQVTAQLTFSNSAGQYCRQVAVSTTAQQVHYLACRDSNANWLKQATSVSDKTQHQEYATASSTQVLEDEIDAIIDSATFNRIEEQSLINQQWGPAPNKE